MGEIWSKRCEGVGITWRAREMAEAQKPKSWFRAKICAPMIGDTTWKHVAYVQILACSRAESSGVRPKVSDQRASITGKEPAEKTPQPRIS